MKPRLLVTALTALFLVIGGLAPPSGGSRVHAADKVASPAEVFEQRIAPIFKSPNPSSCTQCHLSGVDLKDYLLPSSEKSFLSLRDQGLIDVKKPAQSKILKLIQMGAGDKPGANLIQEKVRKAEYEAFAAWIEACCNDAALRDAPKLDAADQAKPARPVEVIRFNRSDRLLESFERNVWAFRFRCMNCHTEGTPQNDKLRKEHGDRVAWFKKAGPEATMNYLRESKLIDLDKPDQSLLLLKPLKQVEHGGGIKFIPGDQGYKGFRAWIEDYAAVVKGKYNKPADIPAPVKVPERFGSDIWFKVSDTPDSWGDKLLQVTIFAWDAEKKTWESEPIATSDRGVWGKGHLWQHNLTLLAEKGSKRAEGWQRRQPSLPAGRYLVRVYVDNEGKLGRDWQAILGDGDFAGQGEIESRWPEGYGTMTVLDARKLRK
jgi:hypothetical protein